MACDGQKLAKPIRCHAQRKVIYKRMEKQHLGIHQRAVQCQPHPLVGVIDQGKGTDRARAHTKKFKQPIGTAKGKPVGADLVLEGLKVDIPVFLGNHQEIPLLAVTKIQVLYMGAVHLPAKGLGILDRAKRRMFVTRHRNARTGQRFD